MLARKGKFVSIAGAGGNVVSVEDGVATLRAGRVEFRQPIRKLDAKGALTHADLKDDDRSKLMRAVFLLAEAADLAVAEKALAAIPESPSVAIYKARLDALKPEPRDPQEVAAQAAWRKIADYAQAKLTTTRAKRLLAALEDFEGKFANTELYAAVREGLGSLRGRCEEVAEEWVSLFDGKTLRGWSVADQGWFSRHGNVAVENGQIVLKAGDPMTGIATTREVPADRYELSLEAMRVAGGGAFAGIVFPVGSSHCILEVGGKGGRVVGLGVVDGRDQNANATTTRMDFELGRWYRVRVAVTQERIQAWLDDVKLIDIERAGHQFTLWGGFGPLRPLGVHAWATTAALRNIRLRRLGPAERERVEKKPDKPVGNLKLGKWYSLFDGRSLRGWRVEDRWRFNRHGEVAVEGGQIALERGHPQTGVAWTASFPALDYEVELEAKRVTGRADFASITFPVGSSYCTFHIGCGWDKFVGLSRVDGRLCEHNETGREMAFQNGRWYRLRVRVTGERIGCWIDDEQIVDFATAGRKLTSQYGALKPFGIAGFDSSSALRRIRLRLLGAEGARALWTAAAGGEGGVNFEDQLEGPGYLVGFRHTTGFYGNALVVKSLAPIYRTPHGLKAGRVCGPGGAGAEETVAKTGYAVGALVTGSGNVLDGFKMIFMRVRGDSLNPKDSYESTWIGGPGGVVETRLGGSGRQIIGIHGGAVAFIDALGLIERRR